MIKKKIKLKMYNMKIITIKKKLRLYIYKKKKHILSRYVLKKFKM